jgi:hypothetical protein
MIKIMMGGDPMSPERVAERRAAVLDFITAALFVPDDSRERTRRAWAPAPHNQKESAQ